MSPTPSLERSPTSKLSLAVLALAITAVWGFNFVVIKVGTDGVPPLLLATLRFSFVAVPAVFIVRRPRAPLSLVIAYGLFLGVGEFGLLFMAIKLGAPSGSSSLFLQAQAFFTALLATKFLGERFGWHSAIGMAIAASGLGMIGWRTSTPGAWGGHFAIALTMLLGAALMWAIANVLARRIGDVGALNLIVWSSLAAPAPLLVLSLAFEGPNAIVAALRALSWLSIGALAYLVLLSTLFGYAAWNHLIVRFGAGEVAPFSMLVPIFGIASGALFLGERLDARFSLGAGLVLVGLGLHAFGRRRIEVGKA
jgi:O-acetylserine/cysteine efflux transporter